MCRLWLVSEINHFGLVQVKFQPVLFHSFSEHIQHTLCVVIVCKQHHKIIGKAHQSARATQSWLHRVRKPFVQHGGVSPNPRKFR